MRFVDPVMEKKLFDVIHEILLNKSICPFQYRKRDGRILAGEEEAAFTWITVNYLKNKKIFNTNR